MYFLCFRNTCTGFQPENTDWDTPNSSRNFVGMRPSILCMPPTPHQCANWPGSLTCLLSPSLSSLLFSPPFLEWHSSLSQRTPFCTAGLKETQETKWCPKTLLQIPVTALGRKPKQHIPLWHSPKNQVCTLESETCAPYIVVPLLFCSAPDIQLNK